jgi:hypothetical protein
MAKAQPDLDAILATYMFPRGPVMAYGLDTRQQYVDFRSVDPIDFNEGLKITYSDKPNPEMIKFLEWRLQGSDKQLLTVLKGIAAASPKATLIYRADPNWNGLPLSERNVKLNDWMTALSAIPNLQLLVDVKSDMKDLSDRFSALETDLKTLGKQPPLWLEGTPDAVADLARRLEERVSSTSAVTSLAQVSGR